MATNKNITMKQYNGTDYDVLYPKTKVSQVDGAVASVNNATPDNTGAVKVDTFDQSIKVGKNVDVGTDGGASAVQFHFDGNANAYTSRIVESESGALTVEAILKLTQALGLEYGGTGATTAADARTNLGLGAVATNNVVPISNGGTGATTAGAAVQNLFSAESSATSYPTKPGIYRTIGTNVFSNLTDSHSNYGVLIIFKAVYALHLYIDSDGYFFWGYSGDDFREPTNWYGINRLSNNCYGAYLPSPGIPGRLFYKKV